jgi:hypothetical protein
MDGDTGVKARDVMGFRQTSDRAERVPMETGPLVRNLRQAPSPAPPRRHSFPRARMRYAEDAEGAEFIGLRGARERCAGDWG